MNKFKFKSNTIKKIIFPIIIILIIVFIVIIKKEYNFIDIFRDAAKLKSYILSFGSLAPIVFGVIQFLQVIISPIPGNLTTVVGGALFGFWKSLIISSIGIILGSAAAFGIARAFGRPFVEWLIGKEKVSQYLDTVSKNEKIIFVLIILLPFFPDDILCLVAGISGMSWGFFMLTMLVARPPGLVVSALVGTLGLEMPVWAWIAMFVIILSVVIGYFRVKKIIGQKDKK
ncbi:MAG: VTT domain-containing protein [Eubacteriales bacterium]